MTARFAPAKIGADTARLDEGDRKALAKLLEAAHVVDELYLEQAWSGNFGLRAELRQDKSELGKARLRYFELNKGPWSGIDGHAAFLPGVPAHKPAGANFYPTEMSKEAFEKWAKAHPGADGFFSVIRQKGNSFEAIPYSKAYAEPLQKLAALLREAAQLTTNDSLKTFLRENVYKHYKVRRMTSKARRVVGSLFDAFFNDPSLMPDEHKQTSTRLDATLGSAGRARAVADYIAGMTDRYAILEHRRLFDPSERT